MRFLFYLSTIFLIASCTTEKVFTGDCYDPNDVNFFHCIPIQCEPLPAANFFDGTFDGSKLCIYESPSDSFALNFYGSGYQFLDSSLLPCQVFQAIFYPNPLNEGDLVLALEFKDTTSNNQNLESFLIAQFEVGRNLLFSEEETTDVPERDNIHGVSVNIGGYSSKLDRFYQSQLFSSSGDIQPDWAYVTCTRFQKSGNFYEIELDVRVIIPNYGIHYHIPPYKKELAGKFSFKIAV